MTNQGSILPSFTRMRTSINRRCCKGRSVEQDRSFKQKAIGRDNLKRLKVLKSENKTKKLT